MGRPRPRRRGHDMSGRIDRAVLEYDNFAGSNDDDPERAKRFYARHNALKVCVGHIHALQQIEGSPAGDSSDDAPAMVARARAALAQEDAPDEAEEY